MRHHGLIALARCLSVAIAATLACAVALSAAAHDIPTDVKINVFVKPAGKNLELLIRVPLAAMIEVDVPTRGPGYLDLSRADEALRNATKLHLIDNITVYENGAPLPPPRILVRPMAGIRTQNELASSIVPAGTSLHRSAEFTFLLSCST